MSKVYQNIKAVKQAGDTTCWAASLEWWSKAVEGGRQQITQKDALQLYRPYWESTPDATISKQGMFAIINDTRWRMRLQWIHAFQFCPEYLNEHLVQGPIYIGYYEKKIKGNHVNVIYQSLDGGENPRLRVMEPNGGRHAIRNLSYYTNVGELLLASPKN